MLIIIGCVLVVLCTFGGYMAMGGHMAVLWQPFEVVIICGAAAGTYVTANTPTVLKGTMSAMTAALKGSPYTKQSYLDLLGLQYQIYKMAKSKGMLALETHIENPEESDLFAAFPSVANNHHALTFLRDYLRLISLGTENPHTLEDLMDEEIETHHHESTQIAGAVQTIADAMPALGIVAAVLGIIKTMGAITEPPEVLGKLIGGALVGTFLGVWIAYGFIAPVASAMKALGESEQRYYMCIKAGLLAYLHGYAPAVAVEFARKALFSDVRPDFYEVEESTANLPPAA
jgi:chemotaxis protein MotA